MAEQPPSGRVKSGYVFSLFSEKLRRRVSAGLSRREVQRIQEGTRGSASLSARQRSAILREFIRKIRGYERRRKEVLDNALMASVACGSALVVLLFAYSLARFNSAERIIDFIELALESGGMHVVAFPLVWGFIESEFGVPPLRLLADVKTPFPDLLLAPAAGLVVALLFVPHHPAGDARFPSVLLQGFYVAVALTAGPASEELFFRYFMFWRLGKRHGYLFCAAASSVLFAAVHLPDSWALFVRYVLSGSIMCALLYYRKTVFTPLLAHVTANAALLFL